MCKPNIKKIGSFLKSLLGKSVIGITLAPLGIYLAQKIWDYKDTNPFAWDRIVNHEKIHWAQQLEMFIIFFYLWYFFEWLIKLILPPHKDAYKRLSFEREANDNETNFYYLKSRKHYAWIKRVFK